MDGLSGNPVPSEAPRELQDNTGVLLHILGTWGYLRNLVVLRGVKTLPVTVDPVPAELYSYTEEPELSTNRRCFEEEFCPQGMGSVFSTPWHRAAPWPTHRSVPSAARGRQWPQLDTAQQKAHILRLLEGLEVVSRERRLRAARAILYLAQGEHSAQLCPRRVPGGPRAAFADHIPPWASPGVFGDCESEGDVLHWSRHNSFLLYQLGTFSAFLELLSMEIE